ncbi:aspartyl/asparaginyl beta-hydroxylase domain-containing protein [Pedobacter petrophilus]|nr:aspartyl/asparaginyl beta-hydroxylase domain-containing protein [Pedobacter petrophilus]
MSVSLIHAQPDLCNLSYNWTAHFNTLHYKGSWTVLPLRTPGGMDNILPDLINSDRFGDHPNMMLFPHIKSFIDGMKCELMSVRLLRLAAGSVIKQHRDMELAFEKGEARLHIPIQTNAGVEFYINDERIIMNEGECWYINANLPHRVTNNGNTDRIHLVIDCKVNAWLKQRILNTDTIAHAPDESRSPELLKQMIISLKAQGTDRSLQMAMELQAEYNTLVNSQL